MPLIKPKIQPTSESAGLTISPKAFSAPFQAAASLGQQLERAGVNIADIAIRMDRMRMMKEIATGKTAYETDYDVFSGELRKDTDYPKHREKYDKFHQISTAGIIKNTKSKRAQEELQLYFEQQKAVRGGHIEARAWQDETAETAAQIPSYINSTARRMDLLVTNGEQFSDANQEVEDHLNFLHETGVIDGKSLEYWQNYKSEQLIRVAIEKNPEQTLIDLEAGSLELYLSEKDIDRLDPQTLDQLKSDAKREISRIEAENTRNVNQQNAEFNRVTTQEILTGNIDKDTYSNIVNHPTLTGPGKRELIRFYEVRIKGSGKTYTPTQQVEAYMELQNAKTPEEIERLGMLHADGLGLTTVKPFLQDAQDMRDGKPASKDDPILDDALGMSQNIFKNAETIIKKAEGAEKFDEKEMKNQLNKIGIEQMRRDQEIRSWFAANKDADPKIKMDYIENYYKPIKEEIAKEIVKRARFQWVQPMPLWGPNLESIRWLGRKFPKEIEVEIPRITNDAERDALESGTVYIDPEGKRRTKR